MDDRTLSSWMQWYGWQGQPITLEEWLDLAARGRHVGDTYIRKGGTMFRVSTVLLGTDQAWGQYDKPMIFETMTFADNGDTFTNDRYFTLAQAARGHRATVKRVRRLRIVTKQLIHKGRKP
jgi:hypothetical protein